MSDCEHCYSIFDRLYIKDILQQPDYCPWCRISALEKVAEITRDYVWDIEQVDLCDVEDALRAAGYLGEGDE